MRATMLAVLVLCACAPRSGGDGGSGGGLSGAGGGGAGGLATGGGGARDAGPLVAANATFCHTYAEASCASYERCGNSDPAISGACRKLVERQCVGQFGARLDAGAVVLDLPRAQRCLDELGSRPCHSIDVASNDGADPCRAEKLLLANARAGERCGASEDCVDSYCFTSPAHGRCPHCNSGNPIGSACRFYLDCDAKTAFCSSADGGTELSCLARLTDGAPCTSAQDCASNNCYRATGAGAGVCGEPDAGAPCQSFNFGRDCGGGRYCEDHGAQSGVCATRVPTGQPCTNNLYEDGCADSRATCLGGSCTVTAPGTLALGAECDSIWQCAPGSFCAGLQYGSVSSGTCQALRSPGASCTDPASCPGGTRCSGGKCQALGKVSDPCTDQMPCAVLLTCDGVCKAPAAPGQPCSLMTICEDSYCDAYFSGVNPGTCRPYLSPGSICTHANDVIAPFICEPQSCYPASDGGDFTECVDCLPGTP